MFSVPIMARVEVRRHLTRMFIARVKAHCAIGAEVTTLIKSKLQAAAGVGGTGTIEVNNSTMGGDPAMCVPQLLRDALLALSHLLCSGYEKELILVSVVCDTCSIAPTTCVQNVLDGGVLSTYVFPEGSIAHFPNIGNLGSAFIHALYGRVCT